MTCSNSADTSPTQRAYVPRGYVTCGPHLNQVRVSSRCKHYGQLQRRERGSRREAPVRSGVISVMTSLYQTWSKWVCIASGDDARGTEVRTHNCTNPVIGDGDGESRSARAALGPSSAIHRE